MHEWRNNICMLQNQCGALNLRICIYVKFLTSSWLFKELENEKSVISNTRFRGTGRGVCHGWGMRWRGVDRWASNAGARNGICGSRSIPVACMHIRGRMRRSKTDAEIDEPGCVVSSCRDPVMIFRPKGHESLIPLQWALPDECIRIYYDLITLVAASERAEYSQVPAKKLESNGPKL